MRKPEYLSPSALMLWMKSQQDYFLRYLSEVRPDRDLQNLYMAVGSAFDAYIKADLYTKVIGGSDPKFSFDVLFEESVELQNRDEVKPIGQKLFEQYASTQAYKHLLERLTKSIIEPQFETSLKAEINGVPLFGKPDILYKNPEGFFVILDFKVNGYYSKNKVYPKKGYVALYENGINHGAHKDSLPMVQHGERLNVAMPFESVNREWAIQTTMYSWLTGVPVGNKFIAAIDQVIPQFGSMKIACHRSLVSSHFQLELIAALQDLWNRIQTEHIFMDLDYEASKQKCKLLESMVITTESSDKERWLAEMD